MPDAKKRGRGRPRTMPAGAKARAVFLTDEEWDGRVLAAALAADSTRNEWMRHIILTAAKRRPKGSARP